MWPYPWTHVGTPSHLGHMDRVAATMPSQAHAGAAQEAPDIGQWEGQDVPLVRPSSCNVKGGIPSSRRYLPTYLPPGCGWVWVLVTPAVLAEVLGGCVCIRFVVSSLFCWLGFVAFVVGLGFRPAPHLSWLGIWDARGCVRAPPAPRRFGFRSAVWACVPRFGFRPRPATPWGGVGVCVWSCARPAWCPAPPGWGCCAEVRICARALLLPRLSWLECVVGACVLGPGLGSAPLFLVGLSGGALFLRVLLWLSGVGRWLSLSRALWSLSRHPLSLGLGCWPFFIFRPSVVCVCAFWVSLPPVGRCSWLGVAGFG